VAYFDGRGLKENPAVAGQAQSPEDAQPERPEAYAQSFEMTIHVDGQDNRLWVRDLDEALYFRLSTEVGGSPVSHQIYRHSERTLYVAEQGPGAELTWSRMEDVDPDDIGLVQMVKEPAEWAVRYGPGQHQIQVPEGELDVTIHSVEEPITDDVFDIAEDAEQPS
jgi:hypothetical protein